MFLLRKVEISGRSLYVSYIINPLITAVCRFLTGLGLFTYAIANGAMMVWKVKQETNAQRSQRTVTFNVFCKPTPLRY